MEARWPGLAYLMLHSLSHMLMTAIVLASAGAVSVQAQTPQTPAVKPIEVGAVAPDFELPAATRYGVLREPIKLSDFKGKTVVLAFFPKARTSGCTIQMHTYRDQYDKLFNTGQNIVLIAISADTPEVLASWAKDDQFQMENPPSTTRLWPVT